MKTLPLCLILLFSTSVIASHHQSGKPYIPSSKKNMIVIKSSHSVKTTTDRLENTLNSKGMTVFARINHSEGAKKAGISLRSTELVIFGNPKVGSILMQCAQTVAIDLPQKMLIWEDHEGSVFLGYNQPQYLVKRHQIYGCDNAIKKVTGALKNFAKAATSK